MRHFFADLHVHLGSTSRGKAVKITASRRLTFQAVIEECYRRKGVDLVGIVDCASPGVQADMEHLVEEGELAELPAGGLIHRDRVVVIPGAEIECVEEGGAVSHHLGYFPYMRQIRDFSRIMKAHIRNMELSSQSCGLPARELLAIIKATGGIYVPAHAFTPHKSIYGRVTDRLSSLFSEEEFHDIAALELGLSADTAIADLLAELHDMTFLSNSDAHSAGRIAREYNILELEEATFQEMVLALRRAGGRRVIANFGMDPRLGRYHRSFCQDCDYVADDPPPVKRCKKCGGGGRHFVMGVLDRVVEIGDSNSRSGAHPSHRPAYHYQVPLHFVPGLSDTILERLISHFGSEMAVLHDADRKELQKVVGWQVAGDIVRAREGKLVLAPGGGGNYGKVCGAEPRGEQLMFTFT
jgi:uncharacterized protein (TIGR00375 family)